MAETMGGADLHVHSNCSDGSDPPARVVARAAEAGLVAFALTDHDTTGGLAEAFDAGRALGIEVIAGIELSVDHEGSEVHLLGYYFRPDDAPLQAVLAGLEAERAARIARMVLRLHEAGLPVSLEAVHSFAGGRSIGRPHIADALVAGGFVSDYETAWSRYLKPGGLAWVDRLRIGLAEAIAMIGAAGGVTSIAHPTLNLDIRRLEGVAASGIAGFEATHPCLSPEQAEALADLCRRHGLVPTGGSDCHGDRRGPPTLGRFRVPLETVQALRALCAA